MHIYNIFFKMKDIMMSGAFLTETHWIIINIPEGTLRSFGLFWYEFTVRKKEFVMKMINILLEGNECRMTLISEVLFIENIDKSISSNM
jgi:hypothetical protein